MTRTVQLRTLLIALPLLASSVAVAADKGQELHEAHCTSCHSSEVYTRQDRRVKDLAKLHAQVGRCAQGNDLDWSAQDIDAVATYLNGSYYKF